MNDILDPREEQAILLALERLEALDPLAATAGSAEDSALVHEYVELLGLLPETLEPLAPSPDNRARLLERVAEETRSAGARQELPSRDASPRPMAMRRRSPAPRPSSAQRPRPATSRPKTRKARTRDAGVSATKTWWSSSTASPATAERPTIGSRKRKPPTARWPSRS